MKDWLSIARLPRAVQAAITVARRANARHGDGAEDALIFFVAREAYAAGRRRELAKAAAATPGERHLRKHLTNLTSVVRQFVERLDATMAGASTVDRGREIAALRNALDFANDGARLFGLKIHLAKLGKKPSRAPGVLFGEVLTFVRAAAEKGDENAERLLARLEGRAPCA